MWISGAGTRVRNLQETGILEELLLENMYRNPKRNFSIWDSLLYEMVRFEPNIELLLNCSCCDAEMDGSKVVSVTGFQLTTYTWHTVKADIFMDCSGDSILAPLTGAEFRVGREAQAEFGEEFGLPASQPVMGKIVTALKMLGADYVFDTSLTADLTIMEESAEFMEKLKTGAKLPMFTSCCPGWIKHVENMHPHLMPQVSTCGSPMEMFGAILRQHYTDDELYSVAIMPCTAKKAEAARPELVKDGERLIDLVLTTQELVRMIKEAGIDFANLPDTEPDDPFAEYTGAGVIFGATGGVTEAVIRHVLGTVTAEQIASVAECGVRGLEGIKAFEVKAGDLTLKIAVANGLGNADKLIEKIESGEEFFHFVEIMACPGGCIGGGGQPSADIAQKRIRTQGIFNADEKCTLRSVEQNTALDLVYALLRGRAHDLLHVHYPDHGHE